MSSLTTHTAPAGAWTVLGLAGDVDVASAPQLRRRLLELVAAGDVNVVVDCTDLDFIDSTGLGVLLGAYKRIRDENGELRFTGVSEATRRALKITGLVYVFDVRDSIAAATETELAEL